jgi:hypothetical protein
MPTMSETTVFAFECNVSEHDWQAVVHARTAGQAKSEYWSRVRDSWPDIPYTTIRCRKLGAPRSSLDFIRCADGRGVVLRCGDRVRVGPDTGVIVGHNSSANFDVLFDRDSRYPDQRLNVHPASISKVEAGAR